MAEIRNRYDAFRSNHTAVFALSVDAPNQSAAVAKEMQLPFELLCDTDKQVTNAFHLLNPFEHGGIAYPAIFLIDPAGTIFFRSLDRLAQRVDLSELIDFLSTSSEMTRAEKSPTLKREWMLPTPGTQWQIFKNMIFRGNAADWKHYLLYPLNMILMPVKKNLKKKER